MRAKTNVNWKLMYQALIKVCFLYVILNQVLSQLTLQKETLS